MKKALNFRLPDATRDILRWLAQRERRSQAVVVELAVEEYLLAHHGLAQVNAMNALPISDPKESEEK